jgi:hypothetical protein
MAGDIPEGEFPSINIITIIISMEHSIFPTHNRNT